MDMDLRKHVLRMVKRGLVWPGHVVSGQKTAPPPEHLPSSQH